MVHPAIIIVPIVASLVVAMILYFTCFTTKTITPPAGWKPYKIRQRRHIRDWFRKKEAGAEDTTRDLERNIGEEQFGMLDRENVALQSPKSHRRTESYHSSHSRDTFDHEGIDIGAEGEISSEDDEEYYEPVGSTQIDLGPTISDVRLTIDASHDVSRRIKDIQNEFRPDFKSNTSSPMLSQVLFSATDLYQINQLQTLIDWHEEMLKKVWQHSGPTAPPIDLSCLSSFKTLLAAVVSIAEEGREKIAQQQKALDIARTLELSRYNDLKRTEAFARASLKSIRRKKRRESGASNEGEPDEMESEIQQLGYRAMRERLVLAKKLELTVMDTADETEWGLDQETMSRNSGTWSSEAKLDYNGAVTNTINQALANNQQDIFGEVIRTSFDGSRLSAPYSTNGPYYTTNAP